MKLTKSEALAEGYVYYGKESDSFQFVTRLEHLNDVDFEEDGPFLLVEKEPYYTPSINAEDIADLLADNMNSWSGDNTGDDTDDVYDTVKALDFTQTAALINEALKDKRYYKLTKIEVVSDQLKHQKEG